MQITGDNDEPADDSRDDLSTHEDIDRHDSMCSSIEAVVSGAGGQEVNDSRNTDKFIYSCDDCPKLFKRKEHLYQHQKLHTGMLHSLKISEVISILKPHVVILAVTVSLFRSQVKDLMSAHTVIRHSFEKNIF